VLLSLFWVFWSLLASAASRSCAPGVAVVPAPLRVAYSDCLLVNMRKIDGWQTLATNLIDQPIDLVA
jgi:hypothetical protein